jgi:hypothetical protein
MGLKDRGDQQKRIVIAWELKKAEAAKHVEQLQNIPKLARRFAEIGQA